MVESRASVPAAGKFKIELRKTNQILFRDRSRLRHALFVLLIDKNGRGKCWLAVRRRTMHLWAEG